MATSDHSRLNSRAGATYRRRLATLAGYSYDEPSARRHLSDSEPRVRIAGLGALARMGRLTVADLDSAIGDPDPAVRRRGCELSAQIPGAAPRQALSDRDPSVAEMAAWTLGEHGDTGAVEELSAMARSHPDPLCREAAVAALGALGDTKGLDSILAGLEDKPAIRRRAVIALAPFEGPEVEEALRKALCDRDWQVRQAAEDLLGGCEQHAAEDFL